MPAHHAEDKPAVGPSSGPPRHSGCCGFPSALPLSAVVHEEALPSYSSSRYVQSQADAIRTISNTVDGLSAELRQVSIQMHDNPEIGWKEFKTAELLSGYMEKQEGWRVTRKAYGTETGWEAVFQHGQGGRTIGVSCVHSELGLSD